MPRLSLLDIVIVLALIAVLLLAARQDFSRFDASPVGNGAADATATQP